MRRNRAGGGAERGEIAAAFSRRNAGVSQQNATSEGMLPGVVRETTRLCARLGGRKAFRAVHAAQPEQRVVFHTGAGELPDAGTVGKEKIRQLLFRQFWVVRLFDMAGNRALHAACQKAWQQHETGPRAKREKPCAARAQAAPCAYQT